MGDASSDLFLETATPANQNLAFNDNRECVWFSLSYQLMGEAEQ